MTARVEQVLWTLFHLDDLDADFARYYRREWWQHSGPQFFARAVRLPAYGGALAATIENQRQTDPLSVTDAPDILDALDDPALAGLVEVG